MKSKLTSQEMQALKEKGVPVNEIAKIANLSLSNVYARLNPEHYRQYRKQWMDGHPDYEKQRRLNNPTYFTDWRKNHPEYRARQLQTQKKHNDDTIPGAANHRQEWTIRDLKYLEEHAGKMGIKELAAKLGRTSLSIKQAAFKDKISLRTGKKNG